MKIEKIKTFVTTVIVFCIISVLLYFGIIEIRNTIKINKEIEYYDKLIEKAETDREKSKNSIDYSNYSTPPFLKSTIYYYNPSRNLRLPTVHFYDRRYTPVMNKGIEYLSLELDLDNNIAISNHNFTVKHKILSISYDITPLIEKNELNSGRNVSATDISNIKKRLLKENSDFLHMATITTDKGIIFIFKPESGMEEYPIVFEYDDYCFGFDGVTSLHSVGFIKNCY